MSIIYLIVIFKTLNIISVHQRINTTTLSVSWYTDQWQHAVYVRFTFTDSAGTHSSRELERRGGDCGPPAGA